MKKIKKIYLYIIPLIIILLSIVGTFSRWIWSSSNNAIASGKVCSPEIAFIGGTTINGTDLLPARTKEEGLKKEIYVNLNNTCDNDTAVLNLNLKLDKFPSGLADASFVWELYKGNTLVNNGNFLGKSSGNIISLATDEIITENVSTYTLYVYLDASLDNPSSVGGNSFIFSIYGTVRDAIYRENVMGDYQYNDVPSYFLVNSLPRNSIESIEIAKTSDIPSGVTSYDISSNMDGTVKLWYINNHETNLNKVYIGSENGIVKANVNLTGLFAKLSNAVTIDLTNFDTSSVTTMREMFSNCLKITSLDLSSFDTSNVTTMQLMFYYCESLESLDLSNFDTSNVTSMQSMFSTCKSLESLDLSSFDTSNVTTMQDMFRSCESLESLDLSNFDTSKVTTMQFMFYYCKNLTSLDLSDFDTSNVTSMLSMFSNCTNLTSLDLSSFDTSNVTTMQSMFYNCTNLTSLDLSNFDTSSVTTMREMFSNCLKITSLDLSSFDTSNVTNMYAMFAGTKISDLTILSNFNTSKVTNMARMFHQCTNIKSLNGLENFDVSKVDYYALPSDYEDSSYSSGSRKRGIFEGLTSLEDATAINDWDIKSTAYFNNMFKGTNVHPTFNKVSGTWNDGTFIPNV